jgi:hypothetical protein
MIAAVQAKVDTSSLEKLQQVVGDYVELTGKDASVALQKAAREVDFAMFDQLRNQPPRPIRGSISAAARARGFTLNVNSDSYITGYQQAVAMLGGYKSGYFRISEKDGVVSVAPVFLGAAGRIFKGKPNKRSTDHVLVTPETELDAKARAGIPADAKELNLGALAVILGLKQREKAGSGGYMAAEFLTYKALNRTRSRFGDVPYERLQDGRRGRFEPERQFPLACSDYWIRSARGQHRHEERDFQ